jgi:acetyltransferase-like isoleucine patch superfamily enzyme
MTTDAPARDGRRTDQTSGTPWRRRARLAVLGLVGVLPGFFKRSLYRLVFGYRFGPGVRIGLVLLDAERVDLAEGTRIGHFNVVVRVGRLETGRHARIGALNIIRGGERVTLGDYSEVMRLNVLNAIPDHDCTTEPQSVLEVGAGTVITSGHRIDFTDKVTLGKNVIIGGRNSSLWTHNRQETAPIEIGDFCYLGSEVRLAPGAKLPDECLLAIGSVLAGEIKEPRSLVAGVPAKVVRPLNEKDLARIRRKTRKDMPDGYYERS